VTPEGPRSDPPFDLIEQVDVEGLRVVTVRSALELDIFTRIAEGHDTEEALVVACGAGRPGMHRLVAALRSLELIEECDGRLHNGPTADAYLRAGAVGDVRANYLAWLRNRDHLVEAIVDEDFSLEPHDEATWASYARGDLIRWPTKSAMVASTLAQRDISLPPDGQVLDVGCGSGLTGYTAIRDIPGAKVLSIDSAPVIEVARELATRMGVADRVELVVGDVESIDADAVFDLAFLVHVAQYLSDAALDLTLRRVRSALRPGGRLLLVTIIDDPGTPGFTPNWTSAIEMFLSSPGISLRTPDQLCAALTHAGFRGVESHEPWAHSAFR
jgi:SAM-dependent methyltransferase